MAQLNWIASLVAGVDAGVLGAAHHLAARQPGADIGFLCDSAFLSLLFVERSGAWLMESNGHWTTEMYHNIALSTQNIQLKTGFQPILGNAIQYWLVANFF